MLDKVNEQKGDWIDITDKPETQLTDAACKSFLTVKK
jgi:hypothetical protein